MQSIGVIGHLLLSLRHLRLSGRSSQVSAIVSGQANWKSSMFGRVSIYDHVKAHLGQATRRPCWDAPECSSGVCM